MESLLRKRLAARAAEANPAEARESILDFIPRVSPQLEAPEHLRPFTELLERALVEPLRVVVSTPPQHGKTETTKHAIVKLLKQHPTRRNAYVTYEAERAEAISQEMQWLADAAGLKWAGSRTRWLTQRGGGLLATGIGGPLTGYGINGVLVVDDPFKNRREAESPTIREHVSTWFTSTALTRLHPSASVIIIQTRWHPDDLAGRQIAKGWQYVNLPAVGPDGAALWEKHRPRAWLDQQREEIGEYDWWSLYMGQPRSRGDAVFREPSFYTGPPKRYRVSIGVDLAYSSKTYADYSVAVVLMQDLATRDIYVVDVVRQQCEAPAFADQLKSLLTTYPKAPVTAYLGGTEKGIADFMARAGVRLRVLSATADKFTRAQPVAAKWNAGKVLVPERAPWLDPFLSELSAFTGIKDRHDDQVDALAGAYVPFAREHSTTSSGGFTTSDEYVS